MLVGVMNLREGHRVTLAPFLHAGHQGDSFYERYFGKCAPKSFLSQSSLSIPISQSAPKFHFLFNTCVFFISFPLLHTALPRLCLPFMEATWHHEKKTQLEIRAPVLLSGGEGDAGFCASVCLCTRWRESPNPSPHDLFVQSSYIQSTNLIVSWTY